MRGPREIRRWINRLRAKHGRKNGVVPGCCFDNPEAERKWAKSYKQRARTVGKDGGRHE